MLKLYLLIALLIPLIIKPVNASSPDMKFAVIGDYGNAGPDEEAVANLVKSWNPDFIITLGDNNYDIGHSTTIDANIGQYYHEFISPYLGIYGNGDTVNRFFPSLGNHDWGVPGALPYLNYFSLPGNERYYDFVKGSCHFFVIDSDTNEYDGIDSNSIQAQWLKNALSQSYSPFNIVYFHHSPYCSGLIEGSEEIMRWPFRQWGASIVMSAHEHLYERLSINGMTYIVNGLGGHLRSIFGLPVNGSQVRYRSNFGAMLVSAYEDSLRFKFINIAGAVVDNFRILPQIKVMNLTALIEGRYNSSLNQMQSDTASFRLRNNYPPYSIADSSKGILSNTGSCILNFTRADNLTQYYFTVNHRNSIETWSTNGIMFINNFLQYDFSISSTQAFGNNLKLQGNRYCIFTGDAVKDDYIDLTDVISVFNDAANFITGYVITDFTGDNFVDLTDLLISYNNSTEFVSAIHP